MSASEGVCACALVKAPSKKPIHKANWIVCFSFIILVFSKKYCVSYSFVCAMHYALCTMRYALCAMRCALCAVFRTQDSTDVAICAIRGHIPVCTCFHATLVRPQLPATCDCFTVPDKLFLRRAGKASCFCLCTSRVGPRCACYSHRSAATSEANGRDASDQQPDILDCQAVGLAVCTGRCVCRSIGADRRQIVV